MHTWMRAEPIGAAIRRIGRLGYKALEISGEPERHDIDEVRGLLSENGIRCFGSVTLMLGDRNLLAANEDQRARSIGYVNDCITMVKELGGEEISVVPATVGKITPDSTPENEWRWAVDALKEIYEHGIKSGVLVLLIACATPVFAQAIPAREFLIRQIRGRR